MLCAIGTTQAMNIRPLLAPAPFKLTNFETASINVFCVQGKSACHVRLLVLDRQGEQCQVEDVLLEPRTGISREIISPGEGPCASDFRQLIILADANAPPVITASIQIIDMMTGETTALVGEGNEVAHVD